MTARIRCFIYIIFSLLLTGSGSSSPEGMAQAAAAKTFEYTTKAYADINPFDVDLGYVNDSIFSVDIFMKGNEFNCASIGVPLVFYSPAGDFINFTHHNIGGYSVDGYSDSSIWMFPDFAAVWDLINIWIGFSWDNNLPDTVYFAGASHTGGWPPHDFYEKEFSFYFKTGGKGILCVDSCYVSEFGSTMEYNWLFCDYDYDFGGPYCWNILSDSIYILQSIEIVCPLNIDENSQVNVGCLGHFQMGSEVVDSMLDPCEIEWSIDCQEMELDSCGILTVPELNDNMECNISASILENDITFSDVQMIALKDTSLGGASCYAAPSRIDMQPDLIDGWIPFRIDIYMKNIFQDFTGCSIPLVIYSPDNSIQNLTHYNVGGYSAEGYYDSSILMFNNFDSYWQLFQQWTGFSWDGQLPDSINFAGAGLTGWPMHDDYRQYFGFSLRTDEIGILCIDSCGIPGGTVPGEHEWLFDTNDFSFGGPYCWQIGNYIPRLTYLTMLGADTIPEGSQAAYNCIASYIYFCCIDDVTLNSCDVDWSIDCPCGQVDSCGHFSVAQVDSTLTCRINASFTDDDITVNVYREITILDTSAMDMASNGVDQLPKDFALGQNHPNPFNATTQIEFSLPTGCQARLEIYNVAGQMVGIPLDRYLEAGNHCLIWDSSNLASGVYIYRLTAGEFEKSLKMILIK